MTKRNRITLALSVLLALLLTLTACVSGSHHGKPKAKKSSSAKAKPGDVDLPGIPSEAAAPKPSIEFVPGEDISNPCSYFGNGEELAKQLNRPITLAPVVMQRDVSNVMRQCQYNGPSLYMDASLGIYNGALIIEEDTESCGRVSLTDFDNVTLTHGCVIARFEPETMGLIADSPTGIMQSHWKKTVSATGNPPGGNTAQLVLGYDAGSDNTVNQTFVLYVPEGSAQQLTTLGHYLARKIGSTLHQK